LIDWLMNSSRQRVLLWLKLAIILNFEFYRWGTTG
jgi:hypothetical protein